MSTKNILLSGFGGQGILFAGKLLAYKGLIEDKNVSWLPSYGPEMRGGTASCSVIISDQPVGSPIVSNPDILVAMNLPSLDKFEHSVKSGGMIFVDSSLVERKVKRDDVTVFYVPATKTAGEKGFPTLANMVVRESFLRRTDGFDDQAVEKAVSKVISAKHKDMMQVNMNALKTGAEF